PVRPGGELRGEFPACDAREEVQAIIAHKIRASNIDNAPVVDTARRDVAGVHEIAYPVAAVAINLVVIDLHVAPRTKRARPPLEGRAQARVGTSGQDRRRHPNARPAALS